MTDNTIKVLPEIFKKHITTLKKRLKIRAEMNICVTA